MLLLFQNAFLSALPYAMMWIVSILGSQATDYLRSRNYLSTTDTRKLANSLGIVVVIRNKNKSQNFIHIPWTLDEQNNTVQVLFTFILHDIYFFSFLHSGCQSRGPVFRWMPTRSRLSFVVHNCRIQRVGYSLNFSLYKYFCFHT